MATGGSIRISGSMRKKKSEMNEEEKRLAKMKKEAEKEIKKGSFVDSQDMQKSQETKDMTKSSDWLSQFHL